MKFQSKSVKVFVVGLLLMIAIAACSPAGSGGDVEPGVDSTVDLTGTSWVLVEYGEEGGLTAVLPNTTITIEFEDGRINGSAGCNNYFADATIASNSLSLGPIGSTRMACPDPIMRQEADFLAALEAVTGFTVSGEQLTLQYDGGVLHFEPAANDESAESGETTEEAKTLFVGPELIDCVGVAPQKCMQVRESVDVDWTLFYDQIIGFAYEPGYEYELIVTETEIENPPADGSSIEVTLVEVVSKTAVPTQLPEGNNLQGTSWILTEFGPSDNLTAVLPDSEVTLNFDGEQINGSAGCNSYFGDVTVEDSSLSVGLIGSTLMACADEDISQQEADFLAALGQANAYTLEDNQLTLQYEGGILIFETNETVEAEEEIVDWETAVSILESGDVVEIFQTHSLDVTLTLVDGRVIKTVEPAIDDIFTAIDDCGEPCEGILMATE